MAEYEISSELDMPNRPNMAFFVPEMALSSCGKSQGLYRHFDE